MENAILTAESLVDYPQALARLGLAPAADEQFSRRLATTGLIDCLPLAAIDRARLVVLRAMRPSDRLAPGVAVADIVAGESMLIAGHPSTFLPVWAVTRLVHGTTAEWDACQGWGKGEWELLIALHHRLGGDDELHGLHEVFSDRTLRAALCRDLDGDLWSARLPDAFAAAAPTDGRARVQRVLAEVATHGWMPALDPSTFGAWRGPLETSLGLRGNPPDPAVLLNVLRAAARRPSSHDASWAGLVGVGGCSGTAAKDHGAPILTARALAERSPADWTGPWARAVRSLAAAGSSYDGRAHLEIVESLCADGDHAGAWQAVLTACFWMFRRYGRVHGEVQLLCGRLARELSPEGVWPTVARNLRAMGADTSAIR